MNDTLVGRLRIIALVVALALSFGPLGIAVAATLISGFAIPAMFAGAPPGPRHLNVMGPHGPASAISVAIVVSGLTIVAPIAPASRGVRYRSASAARVSGDIRRYGLGALVVPFLGIKVIGLPIQFIPGLHRKTVTAEGT
ncbi:hypothetical protein [Streptomyces sp. CT34]|uniref:hypothetical protein n=1 Tax=Streptomyces sp. CT34 TaxID=1553907 RepID=UPI0005B869A2|nr:hypothetical protein [Streptomyces sp. CT34]